MPMRVSAMVRSWQGGRGAIVALVLLLAGCGSVPESRNRVSVPPPPPSAEARQCMADLRAASVKFTPLPDQHFGGGCHAINSVKLLDIGTPVTNLGAMTCPLASKFAAWARYGVQPAARLILDSELVRIETYGTYACRNINGATNMVARALRAQLHFRWSWLARVGTSDGRCAALRAPCEGAF